LRIVWKIGDADGWEEKAAGDDVFIGEAVLPAAGVVF